MGINEYLEARNINPSDVGPFLLIHTVLSVVFVGSTWFMCYVGGGVVSVSRHPSTSLLLDSGQQLPKSALLNSFVKVPFISDGIKKNICQAFLRYYHPLMFP
jgi:hypothetical protein